MNLITKVTHQTEKKSDEQAESVVAARCDMKQQMEISDSSPQMA